MAQGTGTSQQQSAKSSGLMAMALEECLLEACKTGDLATVQAALGQGCDVNCGQGYGLRRAVRYNHPNIWKTLLAHPEIKVGN